VTFLDVTASLLVDNSREQAQRERILTRVLLHVSLRFLSLTGRVDGTDCGMR
jgi:hypothetical protein